MLQIRQSARQSQAAYATIACLGARGPMPPCQETHAPLPLLAVCYLIVCEPRDRPHGRREGPEKCARRRERALGGAFKRARLDSLRKEFCLKGDGLFMYLGEYVCPNATLEAGLRSWTTFGARSSPDRGRNVAHGAAVCIDQQVGRSNGRRSPFPRQSVGLTVEPI